MDSIPKKLEDIELFRNLKPSVAERVRIVWEKAEPLLRHVQGTHPKYTSHGPDHALTLLKIVDCVLSPCNITLTDDESYILACATLLHDIGMLGKAASNDMYSQTIRDAHHVRTRKYVNDNYKNLCIDRTYKNAIVTVASAHRKLDIEKHVHETAIGIGNPIPRLKLCAALLRLADECHITCDRIPEDFKVLELPKDSIEHFVMHFNTFGLSFNRLERTIEYSIEIDDEDFDLFAQTAKRKIQDELSGLTRLLQKHGITYDTIVFVESRDELIRKKVNRILLENGQSSKNEIISKLVQTGETADSIEEFLEIYKDDENYIYAKERDMFGLCPSIEHLGLLAETSLNSSRDLPLVFTSSEFVRDVLNREYLDGLLVHSLNATDPREVIYKIFTLSPGALAYLVQNKDNLPRKRGILGSELWDVIKGELKRDFSKYPELLLEPGLLDEVFPQSKYPDDWENLKLLQIVEYHKVFDFNKLYKKWLLNQLAPQIVKSEDASTIKGTFSFSCSNLSKVHENPMHWMIAAHRMRLPFAVESGEEVQVKVEIEGRSDGETAGTCTRLEIKPHKISQKVAPYFYARLYQDAEEYCLEIVGGPGDDKQFNYELYPLLFACSIKSISPKKLNIEWELNGLRINSNHLDCDQLKCLHEVSAQKRTIKIVMQDAKAKGEFDFKADKGVSEEYKQCIAQLSLLQNRLKKRIPAPLSIDADIKEYLLATEVNSNNAQSMYDWLQRKVQRKVLTTLSVEYINEGQINTIQFVRTLDYNIRSVVHFQCEDWNVAESIKHALDDSSQSISWNAEILHKTKEKVFEDLKLEDNWFEYIKKSTAATPDEYGSLATMRFLPSIDRFWYEEVPFVLSLKDVSPTEQWLYEAHYFNRDVPDDKRFYLAAHEGLKSASNDRTAMISAGWASFKCGRVREAIAITKGAIACEYDGIQYTVNINMGLFYHWHNPTPDELKRGKDHYEQAIAIVLKFESPTRENMIEDAINDIETYNNELAPEVNEYLEKYRALLN